MKTTTTTPTVRWTKWELAHLANTLSVYKVRKNAAPQDIVAFLRRQAEEFIGLRRHWLRDGEPIVAQVRRDVEATPANTCSRSNAEARLAWHLRQQTVYERDLLAYVRLEAKLRDHGMPEGLSW